MTRALRSRLHRALVVRATRRRHAERVQAKLTEAFPLVYVHVERELADGPPCLWPIEPRVAQCETAPTRMTTLEIGRVA